MGGGGQFRQCTCNVRSRGDRATIVAVGKKYYIFCLCICSLRCCILRGPGGECILDAVPRRDGARNSG